MNGHTLPGPSLCGFWGLFERDYGCTSTPRPYCRIAPSSVAGVALPFRCPRCRRAIRQFSDPTTREHYHDTRPGRGNHWCPYCGNRFIFALPGIPLDKVPPPGAIAPSVVECAGRRVEQDRVTLRARIAAWLRGARVGVVILGAQ